MFFINWRIQYKCLYNNNNNNCHFHIRDICRICQLLPLSAATVLANSLVSSKFDYSNSLYNGISQINLNKIQRIQNTLARVITNTYFPLNSLPFYLSYLDLILVIPLLLALSMIPGVTHRALEMYYYYYYYYPSIEQISEKLKLKKRYRLMNSNNP